MLSDEGGGSRKLKCFRYFLCLSRVVNFNFRSFFSSVSIEVSTVSIYLPQGSIAICSEYTKDLQRQCLYINRSIASNAGGAI